MKPRLVEAPAVSEPLLAALTTVSDEPDWVRVPSHRMEMDWPLGQVQLSFQPLIAAEPAVAVTAPLKPPLQLLEVV